MSSLPLVGHLIGGKSVTTGTRAQDVFNPATGKAEKRVLLADKATVEQAIANAQARLDAAAQELEQNAAKEQESASEPSDSDAPPRKWRRFSPRRACAASMVSSSPQYRRD
mgnify:CR=1 FL=1